MTQTFFPGRNCSQEKRRARRAAGVKQIAPRIGDLRGAKERVHETGGRDECKNADGG
jgi:hypothetical protein